MWVPVYTPVYPHLLGTCMYLECSRIPVRDKQHTCTCTSGEAHWARLGDFSQCAARLLRLCIQPILPEACWAYPGLAYKITLCACYLDVITQSRTLSHSNHIFFVYSAHVHKLIQTLLLILYVNFILWEDEACKLVMGL